MTDLVKLGIHSSRFIGDRDACCSPKLLSISETELNFRLAKDGTRTPEQRISVTNIGKSAVQIKRVVLLHGSDDFILVNKNSYPSTMLKDQSFDIVVDFTARIDGTALGLIEIFTNEDRLPYVIQLTSRTLVEEPEETNPFYEELLHRLIAEENTRLSEDTRVKREAIAEIAAKVSVETLNRINDVNLEESARKQADTVEALARAQADDIEASLRIAGDMNERNISDAAVLQERAARIAADTYEAGVRFTEDDLVRRYAATIVDIEAATRYAADQDLLRRIKLAEGNIGIIIGGGFIEVKDEFARASIRDEIIIRINADEAEAIARRTLEASFNTALTEANAKIVEESRVYANRYEAIASRTFSLETSFISRGTIESIANAAVLVEQYARSTAISAEATLRDTLIASLRTETNNLFGSEVILREAAILAERTARVTLEASVASNKLELNTSFTNARGITPNGTFAAGKAGWVSDMEFVLQTNKDYLPSTRTGFFNSLSSAERIYVDTTRVYQLNALIDVFGAPNSNYVGITCFGDNDEFLANIYVDQAYGQKTTGSTAIRHYYTGEGDIAQFTGGHTFARGTKSIILIVLGNYPNPDMVAGSQTRVRFLWLDDITNAYAANARISLVEYAQSTATEALTVRVQTAESNFTVVRNDVNGLLNADGTIRQDIISTNARIDSEQYTRANALLAEARRVDAIFASFDASNGETNTRIDALIREEQIARTSAIAAEASRVNTLLASFVTNDVLNSYATAVIIDRNTAISTAISAEVSRVSSLLANYATTGYVDTKSSAEIIARDSAISTAVSAEASRVNSLLAAFSTDSANNLANNTEFAVSTEQWSITGPVRFGRNAFTSDQWWPRGVNALVIAQEDEQYQGTNFWWFTDIYGLTVNEWYQSSMWMASHRCNCLLYIDFLDVNGGFLPGSTSSNFGVNNGNGDYTTTGFVRGKINFQVPASTVVVRCYFGKGATFVGQGNSYWWGFRPQVAKVSGASAPLVPYTPGSDSKVTVATRAQIQDEVRARADAVSAEATRVNALLANYATTGALAAQISAEVSRADAAISNAVGALASTVEVLRAAYKAEDVRLNQEIINSNGEIARQAQVAASATGVVASRAEVINAAYSYLPQANTDRYNEIVVAKARIEEVSTASVTRDSAIVTRNDAMIVEYNGIRSSLTTTQGVVAGLGNRSEVYWAVTADLGGGRGGIELRQVSGQYTTFDITANVRIYGNLLVTGTVNTDQLAQGAITSPFAQSGPTITINPGDIKDSVSGSFTAVAGQAVRLEFKCLSTYSLSQGGSGSQACYGTIYRVQNGTYTSVLPVSLARGGLQDNWVYDFPAAGPVTYVLRFQDYPSTGGSYSWTISAIQLGFLGFKR